MFTATFLRHTYQSLPVACVFYGRLIHLSKYAVVTSICDGLHSVHYATFDGHIVLAIGCNIQNIAL